MFQKQLDLLHSGAEEVKGVSNKVSIGGPLDSPAGLEPPKVIVLSVVHLLKFAVVNV